MADNEKKKRTLWEQAVENALRFAFKRGKARSRPIPSVVHEVKRLAAQGVKEFNLIAQDLSYYGRDLGDGTNLAGLLRELVKVEGVKWIRLFYLYPTYFTDELLDLITREKKICKYVDIPLQHISDSVLKRMHRRDTKESIYALLGKLRAASPRITLRTTRMVGFPGETEEDFQDTLDVVEKCDFDSAFTFIYSKRSGTPAAKMENQVPEDVVKDRFDRLLALVQEKGRKASSRFEGTVQEILVEEDSKEKGIFTGRTEYNLLVHFPGCQDLIGKYVKVKLDTCKGFYYFGTLVD